MAKVCIASVDILRGQSDDPPDPKDANEYVSVAVGVDRESRKPSMIMFEVDPHADQSTGVVLLLVPSGSHGNESKDLRGSVPLPFKRCDQIECMAFIGGARDDNAALKLCSDVVERIKSSHHLIVGYRRNGHTYDTAVNIALFKQAYEQLLIKASAPLSEEP